MPVAGGPGSGKVTHCDSLMQEKRGVTHINMTDLLQQYTVGNVKTVAVLVCCGFNRSYNGIPSNQDALKQ
ncbi:hypothetical protein J6590_071934 [Homalodisca vitripennis]|nr:hypothetical protein J6590_071934 [Homalodisca vitripennis]